MINIQTKIHDRYSVEFKIWFKTDSNQKINKFTVNSWIFIPYNLDINHTTYSKGMFYRDIRTNIRLITPVYNIDKIAHTGSEPITFLRQAFKRVSDIPDEKNIADYEYNIKMFAAIFKSSLRNQVFHIMDEKNIAGREEECALLIKETCQVLNSYRELSKMLDNPVIPRVCSDYFQFGDEFLGNIINRQFFRLLNHLKINDPCLYEKEKEGFLSLLQNEVSYRRERGYPVVDKLSSNKNRDLVYRSGALKKYTESELFLNATKKRDAVLVEQIYLSIAAGISMIFATAIAFSFQLRYGSFTMPLFVALVVSYMLKDRIKDLTRYYFAHKLKDKYYDNVTNISLNNTGIGWSREGVDFIKEEKVLPKVMSIRARTPLLESDNRSSEEKILLYRKLVEIDREQLDINSEYPVSGINDIMRYNISSYLNKMDDPFVPLYVITPEGEYEEVTGEKIYYLNFIMQLKYGENEFFKRYRLVFNRMGINEIEELL